uniref:Uncharacterized protein n=1 Tax=Gasterosteus aculeatus TaxID=69293 RepID=G3NSF7_GASAC
IQPAKDDDGPLLQTYSCSRGITSTMLVKLVTPYCPTRQLRSIDAGLLVVPRVLKSRMGARAFSYQDPLLSSQLPLSVRGADSVSNWHSCVSSPLISTSYK